MKSVEEYVRHVLGAVTPLGAIELRLLDAHGCLLAETVTSTGQLPAFDLAAVDGYAVRTADLDAATAAVPVSLPVVGDVSPGRPPTLRIQPGLSARIAAGAPVPNGADAVVPAHWTDGGIAQVRVSRPVQPGQGIRRAGTDVAPGETVLSPGAALGSAQVALLAALGRRTAVVHPQPRVVVVSTGTELVEPGEPVSIGRVPDASGPALTAAVREAGGTAFRVPPLPDDPRRLADALEDNLIQADLVVTTGGLRPGGQGSLRTVLGRLGTIAVEEVAMSPATVLGFGTIGPDATPLFALPGSPAAAIVAFEVFVRPALRRMVGATSLGRPQVTAVLTVPLFELPLGVRHFVPVRVSAERGGWQAEPTRPSAPEALSGMASANGLAVLGEEVVDAPAGTPVPVWLLDRG